MKSLVLKSGDKYYCKVIGIHVVLEYVFRISDDRPTVVVLKLLKGDPPNFDYMKPNRIESYKAFIDDELVDRIVWDIEMNHGKYFLLPFDIFESMYIKVNDENIKEDYNITPISNNEFFSNN